MGDTSTVSARSGTPAAPPPCSAIVTVGDELLYGETVDTNSAWLGKALTGLGLPVAKRWAVGDVASDIREAVDAALATADLVIVTGGLGPTRDDLTRDAVADLLRAPLREDPELLAALERRFQARGYDRMPASNRSQALVPEGATVLPNAHGTAPGLLLERRERAVVLLPGVPRELRGLFTDHMEAWVRRRFGERLLAIEHRVLHTTGIPESRLSELVEAVLPPSLGPVSLAFLPDPLGVDLRLTVRGVLPQEAAAHLDRLEAILAPVVAPWRFEAKGGDLAEAVVSALRSRGETLAVAESCTGGLVAHRITTIAGVSDVFVGGVVAYANAVKQGLLDVPEVVIDAHGAVSAEVAAAMAHGVARMCDATWGVGVTGVAGPTGGTDEKPVGTVWYAVAGGGRVVTRFARLPAGDRAAIQARAAQGALHLLHERLVAGETPELNSA